MKNNKYRNWLITSLLIIAIAGIFSVSHAADAKDDVVIIVNKNVADKSISKKDLKDIFLNKKSKWSNGKKVIPVTLKSGDIHKSFLKNYVSKTASQFSKYWKKLVFTGKAKAPKTFKNEKEMLAYVAKTPGAIGYVSSKTAKDSKVVNTIAVK